MIKYLSLGSLVLLLTSCYSIPEIEGFNNEKWNTELSSCKDSKIDLAETIIMNKEKLFGKGQAIIKDMLGQPNENELYRRNQKFFYYDLTLKSDSCDHIAQRLSIRFDALDRVKELMIIEW